MDRDGLNNKKSPKLNKNKQIRHLTGSNKGDNDYAVLLELQYGGVEEAAHDRLGRDVGYLHHIGRDGLGVAGHRVQAQDLLLTHVF